MAVSCFSKEAACSLTGKWTWQWNCERSTMGKYIETLKDSDVRNLALRISENKERDCGQPPHPCPVELSWAAAWGGGCPRWLRDVVLGASATGWWSAHPLFFCRSGWGLGLISWVTSHDHKQDRKREEAWVTSSSALKKYDCSLRSLEKLEQMLTTLLSPGFSMCVVPWETYSPWNLNCSGASQNWMKFYWVT